MSSPQSVIRKSLSRVDLRSRPFIDSLLKKESIRSSDFTFANNFIWLEEAEGYAGEINGNLCLFALYRGALAMLLPPVGGHSKSETLDECFRIMDSVNESPADSKVDYVHPAFLNHVDFDKYYAERQNPDYVYLTGELTELRGNRYKTKRNEINYFTKNYSFSYVPYSFEYRDASIDLLYRWAALRLESFGASANLDQFVELMELERKAISRAVDHFDDLGLAGGLVVIDGRVEGMTFGERIDGQTASILVEKTNFKFFGISQYLFREFVTREFSDCPFVNVGDDLGFDNLRKVKMSYHPHEYMAKYTLHRK